MIDCPIDDTRVSASRGFDRSKRVVESALLLLRFWKRVARGSKRVVEGAFLLLLLSRLELLVAGLRLSRLCLVKRRALRGRAEWSKRCVPSQSVSAMPDKARTKERDGGEGYAALCRVGMNSRFDHCLNRRW